ncbi:MAG: hypothetical protein EA393_04705 [Bacteroidetes bacterium]|nr:MAG: hypothetical protein EA393_04705 [Bacteroidota bacterium]
MQTTISETITLEKIHRLALDNRIAFASYKLPYEKEVTTILQWKTQPASFTDILSIEKKSGFLFAPFDTEESHSIRLIQPELVMKGDKFAEPDFYRYPQESERIFEKKNIPGGPIKKHASKKEEYMLQVDELRKMIGESTLDKLVLSRISYDNRPEDFNPTLFFCKLQQSYPDAFVFMIYIADTGLWFGASPEPLLIKKDQKILTVSLAGTRVFDSDKTNEPWGQKELNEQNIVTEYIDRIIKKFGIKDYLKEGPVSQKAGMVEHLRTIFTIDNNISDKLLLPFIKELHPTPSVCGLPKEMALKIIKGIEKYDREYYTGFLGPVNFEEQWQLYVNLRSMKAEQEHLVYYLGAGITSDSDPLKEWEETCNKKNTLQSIVESLNSKES